MRTDSPVSVNGVRVYYFRNVSNWLRVRLKIATPFALPGVVRREIRDFDQVHIHEHRTVLAMIVARYARKNAIPYVVQSHGSVLPLFQSQLRKKIFDRAWGQRVLRDASKLIALTETEAEQYRRMQVPEEKIEIIPNGLDVACVTPLPDKGSFRAKYSIPENEKIVLFLGRIHRIKGVDLLIEAYSRLVQEMPDVTLVVAGPDDGHLSALREQIGRMALPKEPLVVGPLFDQDKVSAYVDADVYVLPSRYEIFGNTVLEAWACGVPVIVTEGCLIAETVRRGGLVSRFDPDDLKEKLRTVLSDDDLAYELGSAGRDLVETQFDLDRIVDRLELVYSDLTAGGGARGH